MDKAENATKLRNLVDAQRKAFARSDFGAAQELAQEWTTLALATATVSRQRSMPVALSIIVVSHNCNDQTLALIDFLATLAFDFSHEVIIVINDDARLRRHPIPPAFVVVDCPVNLGASGGRNLGAAAARGAYLLFLDDDGETTRDSLLSLYDTITAYDATIVRGRVRPREGGPVPPAHYDQGDRILPSLIDIEGMTICNAQRFADVQGFDPLLFGHEGFDLFSRLFRWYGPQSFLYDPNAVLVHDFAGDQAAHDAKLDRYRLNNAYLAFKAMPSASLLKTVKSARARSDQLAVFMSCLEQEQALRSRNTAPGPLVSVLTTARNAEAFVAEFSQSLKNQTAENFEIIFVDDGSTDGTVEEMRRLWQDDPRLVIAPCAGSGRGAALNTAQGLARGEFCIIADVDDLMVPNRIAWSLSWLQKGHDCVAGFTFNEDSLVRGTRPLVDLPTSIRLRHFVGMPVSFPGFAFRRARFPARFDETLLAGIDCDWLYRNLEADPSLDGVVVPYICSYYRLHDGQISVERRDMQRAVGLNSVIRLHSRFIAFDPVTDTATVLKLMGWQSVEGPADIESLHEYASRFTGFDGAAEIRSYLLRTIAAIELFTVSMGYAYLQGKLRELREERKKNSATVKGRPRAELDCIDAVAATAVEDAWAEIFRKSQSRLGRMMGLDVPAIPYHFVEEAYLRANPDVAAQVREGRFLSGFHHFVLYGRAEGRTRPVRKV